MDKDRQIFLTEKLQIINEEGMREIKKSLLERHNHNYCKKNPLKNIEINRWNFKVKQDICIF